MQEELKKELLKKDFYFDLPPELIAQDPLADRSASRLLVLDKKTGAVAHRKFTDIVEYLNEGDCLVLNNTKVIPARLMGTKAETGAAIEVLLLKRREKDIWETLVKPGKKARAGAVIHFGGGLLTGRVLDVVDEGNRLIRGNFRGSARQVRRDAAAALHHTQTRRQKPLSDRLCKIRGLCGSADSGAAFHRGIVTKSAGAGSADCICDFARRTGHLSSGEGGEPSKSSYAFGILSGDAGCCKYH